MSASSRVLRLGTENIGKLLLELSSQTTLSLMVYVIYSFNDTYVLSVGVNPLAAAGAAIVAPVQIGLGAIATTLAAGSASIVSRALGTQNTEKAARAVANTFLIFWAAALAIMVLGTLLITPLVALLGATERIAPYAIAYGRIVFLGAPISTGFSTLMRAEGQGGYATAIWIIPLGAMMALSWLFVIGLRLGIAGAALAMVAGQAVSVGMSVYFFFFRKHRSYRLTARAFRPDRSIIAEVVVIGLPSLLKQGSVSLIAVVMNTMLGRIGGDAALSVFAIVNRLYGGLLMPQTGIVQAMQPLVGYNLGQGYVARVRAAIGLSLRAAVGYGLAMCGLCLLIPAGLIDLLSNDPAVIAAGPPALRLLALAYPLTGISLITAAAFQALGRAREALGLALGGLLLIKLPVLLLAGRWFSLTGIWAAEAASELILAAVSMAMLASIRRRSDAQWAHEFAQK